MGILELQDVTLDLDGKRILNMLSIDFWEGHVHAVVGPNGAGKSTLAMTIMGLSGYRHHEGTITFRGRSIAEMSVDERARAGITLAWQEPARFEGLSVPAFLRAGLAGGRRTGGNGNRTITDDDIDALLDMVGLDPERYRDRAVDKTLSGGERKRIELASIVAMDPDVVLMDEPDSGVDIEAVNNIFRVIGTLKDRGTTVILITHSAEVLKHADHAFLLCHGHLVDKGSAERMLKYFEGKCIPCTHQNAPDRIELVTGGVNGAGANSTAQDGGGA